MFKFCTAQVHFKFNWRQFNNKNLFRNVTCISFKPNPLSYFSLKSSHFIHLFCRNFSYSDNLKLATVVHRHASIDVIDPGFSKDFLPSDFFYTLFASIPFLISSDNGFYWEKKERETSYLHYPITIKNFLDIFRWNMAHKEVLVNMKRKQKCLNNCVQFADVVHE